MSTKKSESKQIWIVIVALFCVLFAVLFLTTDVFTKEEKVSSHVVLADEANNDFQITIHYFPNKKSDAQALSYILKEYGYSVAVAKAASLPALKGSEKSPSHIFFNRSEIQRAMKIKALIEGVVGSAVNAYRFHEPQTDPSMLMVFTDA